MSGRDRRARKVQPLPPDRPDPGVARFVVVALLIFVLACLVALLLLTVLGDDILHA